MINKQPPEVFFACFVIKRLKFQERLSSQAKEKIFIDRSWRKLTVNA